MHLISLRKLKWGLIVLKKDFHQKFADMQILNKIYQYAILMRPTYLEDIDYHSIHRKFQLHRNNFWTRNKNKLRKAAIITSTPNFGSVPYTPIPGSGGIYFLDKMIAKDNIPHVAATIWWQKKKSE